MKIAYFVVLHHKFFQFRWLFDAIGYLKQLFMPLALALISLSGLAYAQSHGTSRLYKQPLNRQLLKVQESAKASAAVEFVKAYIAAGESDDPAARAGYLAP